jgi:hypothetical protein
MAERPITYRGVVKAVVRTPSNVIGLKIQTSSGPTLRVTTASNWTPRSKCRKFPTIIEAIYQNLPRFQITVADRVYGHQLAYA